MENDTFLDKIYSRLAPIDITAQFVTELQKWIQLNRYDTDSIKMDLDILMIDGKSNLAEHIQDEKLLNELLNFSNNSEGYVSLCTI